ncbi:hypothetical protein CVIRNUC_010976 [Coccomyxa viridis]|uniref:Uncharacterized protein n=1 Tax=Coccomyxa viridis TaxID=1274662 RepID=A0AAV1IKB1_9CHLO|nr:hypothetical protein CVIRNUC_010976 [Coccomyxa viridis]
MALRQTIKRLAPHFVQSLESQRNLPLAAFSLQSRAGFAYDRRSGQLPPEKNPESDAATDEYPSPGDTKDMAPSTYAGPDAQKPAGTGAGVSARPKPNTKSDRPDRPDDMRPADGEASAPDFEKDLDKDPHAAKIPEFEGLNVKNEADRDQGDARLPDAGKGGIDHPEKPPGNSPDMSGRAAGFKQAADAPGDRSASDPDSTKGPDEEPKRMDESDVQFAGDKPDPKDIPHTCHQSR